MRKKFSLGELVMLIPVFFLSACLSLSPGTGGTEEGLGFDQTFTGNTLRFDYFHSGIATEEHISLDQIRLEGQWPGSRTQLLDPTNMGKFLFEVIDLTTNRTIYSRGFASIYGEWETTGEAKKGKWRTFQESQRFPEPRGIFQVVLKKRGPESAFHEIYSSHPVDPKSRFINRAPLTNQGSVWAFLESGDPSEKIDIVILADGYKKMERQKFHNDVKRLFDVFFATEPFKSRKSDFNVWGIDVASTESGISNPRKGIWRKNALGLSYNSFDSDRYVLTYENKTVREIAAKAPYDTMYILNNDRKYGGGGIFNLYSTVAADTQPGPYVFVHEFGHSFAGLADEYYTSSVAYEDFNPSGVEPWEPNITALLDPENIKWKDLVKKETPLPTPWDQKSYDEASYSYQKKRRRMIDEGASEEQMEILFREVKAVTAPMLQSQKYSGKVGAFEGAGYQAKGLYRAEADCIMFTRNPDFFCKVCFRALETIMNLYTK